MTKLGNRIRGDLDVIKNIKVTSSCGCVFCDIGLAPDEDGVHRAKDGQEAVCRKRVS